MESSSGGHNLPKIQVFRPTMDEFKDFSRFIEYIELQGAHKAGLAKVIPPKEWIPRRSGYDDVDLTIRAPILQSVSGNKGLYQQFNIQQKPITLKDFVKLANDDRHRTPRYNDLDELERKFWKNVLFNAPLYGADISGSLYDVDQDIWNINRLGTILDRVSNEYSVTIEGVNTAYLYFGMWKTSFCWHTEDMDLYSINYLHYGAPKSWYAVPPEHGRRLERLAAGFFPNEAKLCPAFLRHKMTHISPHVLRRYSIPFNKITQEAGEFMITFPYSYHSGYNHGYNCAESTNFASLRWIEYGKRSVQCTCNSDMVHISMDCFIKNYQPERYDLWKVGLDVGSHPEDDQRKLYPASSGTKTVAVAELQSRQTVSVSPSETSDSSRCHKVSRRHPVIAQSLLPAKEEVSSTEIQSLSVIPSSQLTDDAAASPLINLPIIPGSEIGQNSCAQRKSLKRGLPTVGRQTIPGKSMRQKAKVETFCPEDTRIETKGRLHGVESNSEGRLIGQHELLQSTIPLETGGRSYDLVPFEQSYKHVEVLNVNSNANNRGEFCGWGNHCASLDNSLLVESIHRNSVENSLKSQTVTSGALPVSLAGDGTGKEGFFCKKASTAAESKSVLPCTETSLTDNILANMLPVSYYSDSFDLESPLLDFRDDLLLISEETVDKAETVEGFDKWHSKKASLTVNEVTSDALSDAFVSSEVKYKRKMPRKLEKLTKDTENKKQRRKGSLTKKDSVISNIQKLCPQLAQIAGLFRFLPEDQAAEVDYNEKEGLLAPYCSVCSLFSRSADELSESSSNVRGGMGNLHTSLRPKHSRPSVPEGLFASGLGRLVKTSSSNQFGGSQQLVTSVGNESPLLFCSRCRVCVHASCYGQINVAGGGTSNWICDRCIGGTFQDACCLCMLRGGAMKRTTTGQWSHITCALVISEAGFEDVPMRHPIRIEDITAVRKKLRCAYCLPLTSGHLPLTAHLGVCVQCASARCSTSFHVSCGWIARAHFFISSESTGQMSIAVNCMKHSLTKPKERSVHRNVQIARGEHVIAKHKNGRYYRCLVIGVNSQVFFRVEFEDGSFSNDTFPADIEWPSCSVAVPPLLGTAVKVRWTDGVLYDASFKGTNAVCLYQVQFEDGSVLTLERKDVWSEKEELPKKVTSRLSVATETRHNLFQEQLLQKDTNSRTRSVQLCYIRDENFINP